MTEEGQTEARSGLGLTKDCVASSRSSLSSDMCERLSCQVQKEESQTTQSAESTMDRLPTNLLLSIIRGSRYGISQRGPDPVSSTSSAQHLHSTEGLASSLPRSPLDAESVLDQGIIMVSLQLKRATPGYRDLGRVSASREDEWNCSTLPEPAQIVI